MQPGDMAATMADVSRLERVTGYCRRPRCRRVSADLPIWYRNFYLTYR
jgi:hypothetical protein